ncbi:MAG: ABC transporter permease [Acidobacteria bacterium]|nr:ABC transporter permease [Acidobacteriota bacterium]
MLSTPRAKASSEKPTPPTARVLPRTQTDLLIQPRGRFSFVDVRELWDRRELLRIFAARDIKVRYKRTAIGAAWAIIQPLFTMLIFSIFFGRLAHVPSDGSPYPLFAYTGLVPWMYFANALTGATNSMVENSRVITKVYFPRLLLPLSIVVGGLIDFAISSGVLLLLMAYYGVVPHWPVLLLPVFVLLAMVTSFAVSVWLSALNALYQDVRYVVPFLVQFWMLASPVAYPSNMIPSKWKALYGLNPMAGVIEGFRWALLGTPSPGPLILVSAAVVLLLLLGGLYYFRSVERTFADIL